MNWEAVGAIGEIIGAMAVMVSLIYLAIQVRNNTRQEVFQSFQAVALSYLKSFDRMTATKEDTEVFRQGLNRFGDLPANDQGAFHSKMHSLLHGFHGVWISYKAGMLPEYELVAMRRILLELLMTPGGRQWWKSFKHIPPPHVIAYLEEEAEKLEIYKPEIESAEVAALVRKGHAAIDELDDTERHRYSMFVRGIFETHQTYFVQHKRGSTGPEIWEFYSRSFDNLCTLPGIITWWNHNKAAFDPEYAKYINAKIPCDS